jgi:hypothetical protein
MLVNVASTLDKEVQIGQLMYCLETPKEGDGD